MAHHLFELSGCLPSSSGSQLGSLAAITCPNALKNKADDMSDVVLDELHSGDGREHRLTVYSKQKKGHEIGVIIPANGTLLLAEHQNISDKSLK